MLLNLPSDTAITQKIISPLRLDTMAKTKEKTKKHESKFQIVEVLR